MACSGQTCSCGCCRGIALSTPVAWVQPAGRTAIAHRAGRRSDHLASMLAALSRDPRSRGADAAGAPAPGLVTRAADDFSIALCDAAASLLDVIGFQTERVADEHYLLSAREARSVAWLAELVGYRPRPGVAASVDLAFTLTEAPGAPAAAPPPLTIPAGTRAQSVPDPGEDPQVFETSADLEARVAWNAIAALTRIPWSPAAEDRALWLEGVATGLATGDAILIVGDDRTSNPGSERWDLRILTAVEPDLAQNRTRVAWDEGLGSRWPRVLPAGAGVTVYAFRRRVALFGAAAPDARLLEREGFSLPITNGEWDNYRMDSDSAAPRRFDLDQEVAAVVDGGWVALAATATAQARGYVELYRVRKATGVARSDFGMSAKVTRVFPDTTENLTDARFPLDRTSVFCASEALPVAARPVNDPVYGAALALAIPAEGLAPGRRLAVSGKQLRLRVLAPALSLVREGAPPVAIPRGAEALVVAPPEQPSGGGFALVPPEALAGTAAVRFALRLDTGEEGSVMLGRGQWTLVPPRKEDPTVAAIAEIAHAGAVLGLARPLPFALDRASVRVNANVAAATAGETVAETLGGSTGRPDQAFTLRQTPLTFVPALTPDGRASTLQVRVNGMLWAEAPTLAGAAPAARLYVTREDAEGGTVIRFGDGVEGAAPPAGIENIRAVYRRTLGGAGNVRAGSITTLTSRPAGLAGATNPVAAAGGQDGEAADSARRNAPMQTRTLGRAVSVDDYADLARGFAGIAKARADWIAVGPGRGVLLSVAADAGATVDPASDLAGRLLASLRAYGDPWLPLRVASYRPRRFRIAAGVRLAPDADAPALIATLQAALTAAFAFEARDFGQGVSVDEVAALLHGASASVLAVNVTALHLAGAPPRARPRLFARLPVASLAAAPLGAELLMLDGAPALSAVA